MIDPITPQSITISNWYYQTADTFFDNILYLSKDGTKTESIALGMGYWGMIGTPTMYLNGNPYTSTSRTPQDIWVYMTTVYNSTASK